MVYTPPHYLAVVLLDCHDGLFISSSGKYDGIVSSPAHFCCFVVVSLTRTGIIIHSHVRSITLHNT